MTYCILVHTGSVPELSRSTRVCLQLLGHVSLEETKCIASYKHLQVRCPKLPSWEDHSKTRTFRTNKLNMLVVLHLQ